MKRRIFLWLIIAILTNSSFSQNWQSLKGGIDWAGVNELMEDTSSSALYVVGGFKTVDGMHIRGVAKWDGVKWDSLGSGIDDDQTSFPQRTWAICRYDGYIYIGGAFHKAGDVYTNFVARWNGMQWDSLPETVDNSVSDLLVFNQKLIACGTFSYAGGVPTNRIAQWDGTSWSKVDSTTWEGDGISVLSIFDSSLVIGGNFWNEDVSRVAMWDGENWNPLGVGLLGSSAWINAMTVYKNELYIAGYFSTLDGNAGNFIQKWNGNQWSPVGSGVNNYIWDMEVFQGELYVGGVFTEAGGVPANKIAKWNGEKWCSLGSSINTSVTSFGTLNGMLYIGGGFNMIDEDSINSIAKWTGGSFVDTCENTNSISEACFENQFIQISPNPIINTGVLKLSRSLENGLLVVYNLIGQEVRRYEGLTGTEIIIKKEELQKGLLYFRLQDNKIDVGHGKLIIL